MFGHFLNEHWEIKREMSSSPPDKFIDKCYNHAVKYGVLGGKIMGASTDVGFFMFYHPGPEKERKTFNNAMENVGLRRMNFKFDKYGVITMFDGDRAL